MKKRKVWIDWVDFDEWHWFYLLGFKGEWAHLKGRNSPNGSKHKGGSFWAHRDAITKMQDE
jgi:hypothetical protein